MTSRWCHADVMDITPYVDRLRADLAQTAAAGDEQVRTAAERLALALDPAMRLTLMEVLSEASAEITAGMRNGGVEARLAGRDIDFVVHEQAAPAPEPAASTEPLEEEGDLARITLRIPESIKTRAEELAAKSGNSLNTWLVNVLRQVTRDRAVTVDVDLSSLNLKGLGFPFSDQKGPRRMSGWA